ncbi:MAG TPA: protein kinase, partial [Ilumatobacteraceae bacterium]|nr:protein kinase [Ilumatobacteraceae bacterium]
HPHVVQVYDAGTTESGDPFIVLELIDGPSLAQMLDRQGPLAINEAVRITESLLAALDAAHRSGLIHRDVKPANVLFDGAENAKLADFGIARRFDEMEDSLTATGMVVGTPRYLAPEQAAGQALTPATDVFAAGLLLQEMLIGPQRAAAVVPPRAIELDALRPDVGAAYRQVIRQALHPDPRQRFQSTADMAAALRQAAAAPSIAALLPPTQIAPQQRESGPPRSPRRSPATLWGLLVGAALIALIVGIALFATRTDPTPSDPAPSSAASTVASPSPSTAAQPPAPVTTPPLSTVQPSRPSTGEVIDLTTAADLNQFWIALANDPTMAGRRGEDVRKGLEKILRSPKSAKTGERIAELTDQVQQWKSSGLLDTAVADHLLRLLDRAADNA